MKPTHTSKCTICCWNTAARMEDILQWIHSRVDEVEMQIQICQLHTTADVRTFLDRINLFAALNTVKLKVTKLDVTKMANPDQTIDLVKSQFGGTLRQIILNIAGRKVNLYI